MGARIAAAITSLLVLAPWSAAAAEGSSATEVPERRTPLEPGEVRTTTLDFDKYFKPIEIVRERTEGMSFATFYAEPKLLEEGVAVVFTAVSVAKTGVVPRWRCVARRDIAECLGRPLKLRYLPNDERIILRVVVQPTSLPIIMASL